MLKIHHGIRRFVLVLSVLACFLAGPLAAAGESVSGTDSGSSFSAPVAKLDPGEAEPDPEPLASGTVHQLDPGEAEPDPEPLHKKGPLRVDPSG